MEPVKGAAGAEWLAGEPGPRPVEGFEAVLAALPADDPAPGLEVDVGPSGARLGVQAEVSWRVTLADDELAALRRGLSMLAEAGSMAAAQLESRLSANGPDDVDPRPDRHQADQPDQADDDAVTLVVRLAPALAAWVDARLGSHHVERRRDGSAVVRLATSSVRGLMPWLLRIGPRAELLEPRTAAMALAEGAADLAERYRAQPPEIPATSRSTPPR